MPSIGTNNNEEFLLNTNYEAFLVLGTKVIKERRHTHAHTVRTVCVHTNYSTEKLTYIIIIIIILECVHTRLR